MRNRSSLDVSGNGKALSIVDHIRNITEKNPDMMNLKDFMHHLLTLYAAVKSFKNTLFISNYIPDYFRVKTL